MSKLSTLFTVSLVLFFVLTYAARHEPTFTDESPMKTQLGDGEAEKIEVDENCEGVGKEECLMRRTLEAHVDYIYTQKKHKP